MSPPMILATSEPCVAHGSHEPEPTYCEVHHVIPREWQGFFLPQSPWPNAGNYAGQHLWDNRTDPLCRTGHGNVHHWLVLAMRAYEVAPGEDGSDERIQAAWATVARQARAAGTTMNRKETAIAKQAMIRFRDAGGSLLVLCEKKLYGAI